MALAAVGATTSPRTSNSLDLTEVGYKGPMVALHL